MDMIVNIKNFGKIVDAKIRIRDLTVFAGVNDTGKSYVSRALYSILSSLRANPRQHYYLSILNNFEKSMRSLMNYGFATTENDAGQVNEVREAISDVVRFSEADRGIDNFLSNNVLTAKNNLMKHLSAAQSDVKMLPSNPNFDSAQSVMDYINSSVMEKQGGLVDGIRDSIPNTVEATDIKDYLRRVDKQFMNLNAEINQDDKSVINLGYSYHIKNHLTLNFQVENLQELVNFGGDTPASIEISFNSKDKLLVAIDRKGNIKVDADINDQGSIYDVLYLESPIYWKLKNPLYDLKDFPSEILPDNRLSEVPEYFYTSMRRIRSKYIEEPGGRKKFDELAELIEHQIGGKIVLGDDDELRFKATKDSQEDDDMQGVPLLFTSTGIVQLGMLGLLISRGNIGKETILFMDEPEAHLHTDWQEKVMQVIYYLKKYGVKIIMITQSPTIMQRLEINVKKDNIQNGVALNLFTDEGKFDNTNDDFDTIDKAIADSMNEAPYRMFLEE